MHSYPVLGPVMTRIKHELLTKFLKMNPHSFHHTETGDSFEFIIGCYEKLHKLEIVQQQGVEFITF